MALFNDVFSKNIPLPKLLANFAQWQNSFEYGQLGYYELVENSDSDFWKYWIEDGESIAHQFALWLYLPDGSMIGFWRPSHFLDEDTLPVVLLGSEGEMEVIADSLEQFLYKLADGSIADVVFDLEPDDDEQDARPQLNTWLDGLTDNQKMPMPTPTKIVTSEYLQQFFNAHQQAYLEKSQKNFKGRFKLNE